MDIGKLISHRHSRRKGKKGDTARLAAQLAPLEEQDKQAAVKQSVTTDAVVTQGPAVAEFSGIIVDNTNLHVPQDILEGGGEKTYMGMEPVVLVILGVMLLFIAFVAWQISQMPLE